MVDMVLGVSMAPTKVRMVLVEGESADGVTVDQDNFDVTTESPSTAPAQVVSAILGTRESAAEGGCQLLASGVTWTDPVDAAALRDALAAHKIENVMLVSAFMAAAALAQAVGDATNYSRTALLFVEPYSATLAVINTADGSIADVHRQLLSDDEDRAVAELVEMVSCADALETHPEGVFVVGSGVDIPLIKPALEAATSLALSVSEEPEMALARGAALASANAPLFASSTAAQAYALDPGMRDRPEYRDAYLVADDQAGVDNVAYSAVADDAADDAELDQSAPRRRPILLLGSALSVVGISAVIALEIALAISIRPTVALRPSPNENIIVPAQPAPAQPAPAPAPAIVPRPEIRLPTPVAVPRPIPPPIAAPVPAAPPPVPVAPPPVLVPLAPRVPAAEPPLRVTPRSPVLQPRTELRESQLPRQRGPLPGQRGGFVGPFGGGRGGFIGPFGGWRGGFGGPFGGRGGFGGGRGFGGFGRR